MDANKLSEGEIQNRLVGKQKFLKDKLTCLHNAILLHHPDISRIAIALHEPSTDDVYTFVYSDAKPCLFNNYHAKLEHCLSLKSVAESMKPRIVNSISELLDGGKTHTKKVYELGYRSSATFPIKVEGKFLGFVFVNSINENAFTGNSILNLNVYIELISMWIYAEIAKIRAVLATTRSAFGMLHTRDPETGNHLARVSLYSRLIAISQAERFNFSDQQIECIYRYSMLHDIGKIQISDEILLKTAPLTDDEFQTMKQHTVYGEKILFALMEAHSIDNLEHLQILLNIIKYHHEKLDGSGYPEGLKGNDVPPEARIVAVADIFDALTSRRSYKRGWSMQQAFDELRSMSTSRIDKQCVEAFVAAKDQVAEISNLFSDE